MKEYVQQENKRLQPLLVHLLFKLKLKLELKLEDYDIVHFTIRYDGSKMKEYVQQENKRLQPLLVHLLSSPIPTFPCLTCTHQLMTKAGVRFGML